MDIVERFMHSVDEQNFVDNNSKYDYCILSAYEVAGTMLGKFVSISIFNPSTVLMKVTVMVSILQKKWGQS